jgi:ribosomal protein S18 acetylase RimI-like enzyme
MICERVPENYNWIIKSSYPSDETSIIKKQLEDTKEFILIKGKTDIVGIVGLKKEMKEKIYIYISVLAVASIKNRSDTVLCLINKAKDLAKEMGFAEIYIDEFREPYIEVLKQVGFKLINEYLIMSKSLSLIPSFQPKSLIMVNRIAGNTNAFVEAWNSIINSGTVDDFADFPNITEEFLKKKVQKDHRLDPNGWFVAYDRKKPVGLIAVNKHGELGDIMVSKLYRRLGIGTALVHEAFKYLKSKGFKKAILKARAENVGALSFYQNLGFKIKAKEILMGARTIK